MISVNIHVHNRDLYLRHVLNSFVDQEYKDFEINICETANMNSTVLLLKNFTDKLNINCYRLHIKYIDRAKMLNFLVKKSNGDIICICDTDVLKPPYFLKDVNEKVNKSNFYVQQTKYLVEKETTAVLYQKKISFLELNERARYVDVAQAGQSQTSVFKENFLAIGGYDERFFGWGFEDNDLYSRLCRYGLNAEKFESFGIHLWHKIAPEFKRDTDNKKLFEENLAKEDPIIKNEENIRLDNQWNVNILEPQKTELTEFETEDKIETDKVKLNLGCGKNVLDGYINIDIVVSREGVIEGDIKNLEDFKDETVDEIFLNQVLEHFDTKDLRPVLKEWNRVLKKNGKIIITVPNVIGTIKSYLGGTLDTSGFGRHYKNFSDEEVVFQMIYGRADIFGDTDPEYMQHRTGFSYNRLNRFLEECGFKITKANDTLDVSQNLEIEAIKL